MGIMNLFFDRIEIGFSSDRQSTVLAHLWLDGRQVHHLRLALVVDDLGLIEMNEFYTE